MKNLKVALVQYDTTEPENEKNTEVAVTLIRQAKQAGADFVLFPEAFITSYSAPDICEQLLPLSETEGHPDYQRWCENALTEDGPELARIRETAKEQNIGVCITGFSKGKKAPMNTAWIIDRDGSILLKYNKVHTCDFDWERFLESGDSFPVCEFDDIRMGVMICYDREYPESARQLMLSGAEFIMHPNCCGGMPPRLRELSVRAMENMVAIAMANPPAQYMGNSCAYTPMVWGPNGEILENTLFVAPEREEGIFYVDFDVDAIREYRAREDMGKYRKPKAYKMK